MAERRKPASTGMLIEMDSTLELCAGLTQAIDSLGGKHREASLKMKAHKDRIAFLEQKVASLQAEREELLHKQQEFKQAYQTVRTAQKKAKEDCDTANAEVQELRKVKKELESMKEVYSNFKAKQKERTKSVLERMTAGFGETLVRVHFEAWCSDLEEKKNAEKLASQLEGTQGALKELQKTKKEQSRRVLERMLAGQDAGLLLASVSAWKTAVAEEKDLRDVEQRFKAAEGRMTDYQKQKKEQSKAVMSRMLEAQDSELLRSFFSLWLGIQQEEKAERAAEQRLKDKEASLSEFSNRKKQEARAVLARVTGNMDNTLLEEVFGIWAEDLKDAKAEREREMVIKAEAERIGQAMRQKKLEAQQVLERSLASSSQGSCSLVLKYWMLAVEDEKKEREMVSKAEAQLRDLQQRKRGQAMSVVDRIVSGRDKGMVESVFMAWGQAAMEEKTRREVATTLREQKQAYVDELKRQLDELMDDLEDTQEEVAESKNKTLQLKSEFARLKELEELMEQSFDNILAPSTK
mmetsp:Transcript_54644/g.130398  ORF Transcript_54644/g.130398 Transcript_54644/m.130398 type:complete len:522 (+) Transcript_54644:78-1643(+)